MKYTFFGTRGSIANPGRKFLEYGGNTPCSVIQTNDGKIFILDAGLGILRFADQLMARTGGKPQEIHIFFSHFHWDHIQGLPFFIPNFNPKNQIHIYGACPDKVIPERLSILFDGCFSPHKGIENLPVKYQYHTLNGGQLNIGESTIQTCKVSHPGDSVAIRLDSNGKSIVYVPDHEAKYNESINNNLIEMSQNCSLLVHDAHYSDEDYPYHIGRWHSSQSDAVDNGLRCKAKMIALTHYNYLYNDFYLNTCKKNIFAKYQDQLSEDVKILFSTENLTIVL